MFHWTIHLKGGHGLLYPAAVLVGHKLYSFGGYRNKNSSDQIEVHIFNTVSLRWRKLPPWTNERGEQHLGVPRVRMGHKAVLVEDIVYVWGGYPYCNVLYSFDVDNHRWSKPNIAGAVPKPRRHHSACVLRKVMYIYGGNTQLTGCTNDIYKLDTTTMVWSLINTRGTPLPVPSSHSATIIGTKMFVFGGRGTQWDVYNNITVFDTETNCWLSTPSVQPHPEVRSGHSAFAYNGELYIFGGGNGNQLFNDLWKFNPQTFSWKKVKPKGKSPCGRYWMGCCMVGESIIIFGRCYTPDELYILYLSPNLKMLCKLAVIQYGVEQCELTHDIRWELAAMTANNN